MAPVIRSFVLASGITRKNDQFTITYFHYVRYKIIFFNLFYMQPKYRAALDIILLPAAGVNFHFCMVRRHR
jgi:hypothetical protein